MNIANLCRSRYGRILTKVRYAHLAASQPSTDAEIEVLKKQGPKSSKDVTGISIVSVENYSPITHLSVLVKAGPRVEDETNLGIVHCIKNCAALSTKKHTSFALTRLIEQRGAKLGVSSTREHIIYSLQCIRDDANDVLPLLAEVVGEQAFKPWEVDDAHPRMTIDLALYEINPEAKLMEALHKASYRGGLSNSMYSPSYMVGKHKSEMLHEFVKNNYTSENTVVAGLGINHDHLSNAVTKYFNMRIGKAKPPAASKFGGGEVRIEADLPFTRAAIVAEGASLVNPKEMLSLGLLQCILGIGPQAKHSSVENTKLGSVAAKVTTHPFSVSALNISYSDSGIFGVYVAGYPGEMKEIIKSVVSKMRDVTKNISEEDVKNAKHALKSKMLLQCDSTKDQIHYMAAHAALFGELKSVGELEVMIDSLTISDVNAVANRVMKTKPAMASIGPPHSIPYIDELV